MQTNDSSHHDDSSEESSISSKEKEQDVDGDHVENTVFIVLFIIENVSLDFEHWKAFIDFKNGEI